MVRPGGRGEAVHGQNSGAQAHRGRGAGGLRTRGAHGTQYSELAARIGVEYDVFERWRYHLAMALKGLQVAA